MKNFFILLVLVLSFFKTIAQDQRIFNGHEIDITQAPYQVSIMQNGAHGCGGVIIDCQWVLTAGHCITNLPSTAGLSIVAGATDLEHIGDGQEIEVVDFILHPNYEPFDEPFNVGNHDLVLLRLAEPLQFNDRVLSIPYATPENTTNNEISPGTVAFISGWGQTEDGPTSTVLLGASIPIISNTLANELIQVPENQCPVMQINPVDNSMISFFEYGTSVGLGDSGGPAVLGSGTSAKLIGITSWGVLCAPNAFPSIFADVRELSNFIDETITSFDCCDDIVDFHFENEFENIQNEFCLTQDVYIDGKVSFDTGEYRLELYKTDGMGGLDIIAESAPQLGQPDFVNITALFENDPETPIEFELDVDYVVKLIIDHLQCGVVEKVHEFSLFDPQSLVAFHFEDVTGIDKRDFCLGETVYLNGSETTAANKFQMKLSLLDSNGDLQLISEIDWILSSPNFVNITEIFENNPLGPVVFQAGETYVVSLGIDHRDCGWIWVEHGFTLKNCCKGIASPQNLQVNNITLSWDPVPNAVAYIVSSPIEPQTSCHCYPLQSFSPITVPTANLVLPPYLQSRCFVWQVEAICYDGSVSGSSEHACFNPPLKSNNQNGFAVTIAPNPSHGNVVFTIESSYHSTVDVEVHDFYGKRIEVFTIATQPNDKVTLNWNRTDLKRGVYFVSFKTHKGVVYKKMIVL